MPNEQIEVKVRQGKRLELDRSNPSPLVTFLNEISALCWLDQAARRPPIQEIHQKLLNTSLD